MGFAAEHGRDSERFVAVELTAATAGVLTFGLS